MSKIVATILFLLTIANTSWAQDGFFEFGAKGAGLANATITTGDQYSVFNNIGGLSEVDASFAFVGYKQRYGLLELSSIAAGYVQPVAGGTAGISFYRFGDNLFNQQRFSLGFSNRFGLVSLGANLSYLQYDFESVGSKGAVLIEFGGVAELTKSIRFGAYVFNITQSKLSTDTDIEIPFIMRAGLSWSITEKLSLNTEAVKPLENDLQVRAGINYNLLKNLFLRTGIETSPTKASFGIGYQFSRFQVDYAYSNHSILNDIHDVSVSMRIKKS